MICGPKKLQRALAKVGAGAGCVWELAGFEGLGPWFWVGAVGTASSAGGSGGRVVCAPCPGEGTALPSPTAGGFSSPPCPHTSRCRRVAAVPVWAARQTSRPNTRRAPSQHRSSPALPAAGTMPPFKAPCPGERGRSHTSRGKAGGAQKDVCLPELGFGCSRAACLSCAFKGSTDVWRRSSFKLQNFSGCLHCAESCNAGQSCRGRGAHMEAHATASHAHRRALGDTSTHTPQL